MLILLRNPICPRYLNLFQRKEKVMLVTINNLTSDACIWCCKKKGDAVEAQFRDGLKGAFCRKHFWEALSARADQAASTAERREPSKSAQ
jgi:hypothetical protein